ncbi:hypothetical protein C8R44DRAFT_988413 [Mycena epipterygia]|nr:hypothetical protein C8R44DRAFT_988413 [Mycena epipterygia]
MFPASYRILSIGKIKNKILSGTDAVFVLTRARINPLFLSIIRVPTSHRPCHFSMIPLPSPRPRTPTNPAPRADPTPAGSSTTSLRSDLATEQTKKIALGVKSKGDVAQGLASGFLCRRLHLYYCGNPGRREGSADQGRAAGATKTAAEAATEATTASAGTFSPLPAARELTTVDAISIANLGMGEAAESVETECCEWGCWSQRRSIVSLSPSSALPPASRLIASSDLVTRHYSFLLHAPAPSSAPLLPATRAPPSRCSFLHLPLPFPRLPRVFTSHAQLLRVASDVPSACSIASSLALLHSAAPHPLLPPSHPVPSNPPRPVVPLLQVSSSSSPSDRIPPLHGVSRPPPRSASNRVIALPASAFFAPSFQATYPVPLTPSSSPVELLLISLLFAATTLQVGKLKIKVVKLKHTGEVQHVKINRRGLRHGH